MGDAWWSLGIVWGLENAVSRFAPTGHTSCGFPSLVVAAGVTLPSGREGVVAGRVKAG
mgnify:CR=1 FL=1